MTIKPKCMCKENAGLLAALRASQWLLFPHNPFFLDSRDEFSSFDEDDYRLPGVATRGEQVQSAPAKTERKIKRKAHRSHRLRKTITGVAEG